MKRILIALFILILSTNSFGGFTGGGGTDAGGVATSLATDPGTDIPITSGGDVIITVPSGQFITLTGRLALIDRSNLVISSGTITPVFTMHEIEAEIGATDTLVTLTVPTEIGTMVWLRAADADVITVNQVGNIRTLGITTELSNENFTLFIFDEFLWRQSSLSLEAAVDVLVSDSSETVKGKIEIATQAETDAGTDDTKAITPLKLENFPGMGTKKTVYSLLLDDQNAMATALAKVAQMIWDDSANTDFVTCTLVYEVTITNRDLEIRVFNQTTATSLGSETVTGTSFQILALTLPSAADARLELQIRKTVSGGTDPIISAAHIECST